MRDGLSLSQWYTMPQMETIDVPSSLAGHWAYPAGGALHSGQHRQRDVDRRYPADSPLISITSDFLQEGLRVCLAENLDEPPVLRFQPGARGQVQGQKVAEGRADVGQVGGGDDDGATPAGSVPQHLDGG